MTSGSILENFCNFTSSFFFFYRDEMSRYARTDAYTSFYNNEWKLPGEELQIFSTPVTLYKYFFTYKEKYVPRERYPLT